MKAKHKSIDVHDLPDGLVQAIEAIIKAVRQKQPARGQSPAKRARKSRRRAFPVWPGKVIGSLTREEIYEDVDRC